MDKQTGRFLTLGLVVGHRISSRQGSLALAGSCAIAILLAVLSAAPLAAQTSLPDTPSAMPVGQQDRQSGSAQPPSSQSDTGTKPKPQTPGASPASADGTQPSDDSEGKQPKRILWIIPNHRAVSADTRLPPLSLKDKFVLATQDSFDYSSFVLAGMLAGISQAENSYSEFHQGAVGYGRYYWHSFADQGVGNYFTEAMLPAVTHEDPHYYTLGHGGFFHRSGYALSRLVITRSDSGGRTFNFSEIVGNGAGAGVSNIYYPAQERTWRKTGEKWATQVGLDGLFNIFKEFWPDISRRLSRQH